MVDNLELEISRLENIAHNITAIPIPEIMPSGGVCHLVDFIESDHRRPILLVIHDCNDGRIIHATKSPALESTLVEPSDVIGFHPRDFMSPDNVKHALHRIWMARKYGYHRAVLWSRRNMLENKIDMRLFAQPGEKNLIVNTIYYLEQRMAPSHLTQDIERFDFSAARDFYTYAQQNDMGDLIQEIG